MDSVKKKPFNFRLPFALALSLCLGIAFSFTVIYYTGEYLYLLTAIPASAVLFVICALIVGKLKSLVYCILAVFAFLSGITAGAVATFLYGKDVTDATAEYSVSGRIDEISNTYSGEPYMIISDVTADSERIYGKVKVYCPDGSGSYGEVGYRVTFTGKFTHYDLFPYGNLNSFAADNITCHTTVSGNFSAEYGFSLFGSVRSAFYRTLADNAEPETAAVAYAMLTGNSNSVSEQTLQSFRYGGIAHIFAVSGLHIGVLYAALSALFSKLRVNKYVAVTVKILLLFAYAGVCGFTPSSVRASVMCAVSALSSLVYKKYDALNSLSLAVIIILIINPFYLAEAGFVLSVSAALGIIFLSHKIKRLFRRLPDKIASALSVSLSAQIATAPALLSYFGYVSGAGLLLNVIVLPVLSVLYVIIFAGVAFSAALPPAAGAIIPFVTKPLDLLINLAVESNFEKAVISGFGGMWSVPYFAAVALFASDKINMKIKARLSLVALTLCAFTVNCVAKAVVPQGCAKIIVSGYYGGGIVIIKTSGGTALIITEDYQSYHLESTLNEYFSSNVSSVIILGGDECLQTCFNLSIEFSDAYVYKGAAYTERAGKAIVHGETSFSLYGVDYDFCDSYSLTAEVGGVRMGICAGENINVSEADLLVSVYPCADFDENKVVYFSLKGYENNIYDCGDLIFKAEGGKLNKIGITPVR